MEFLIKWAALLFLVATAVVVQAQSFTTTPTIISTTATTTTTTAATTSTATATTSKPPTTTTIKIITSSTRMDADMSTTIAATTINTTADTTVTSPTTSIVPTTTDDIPSTEVATAIGDPCESVCASERHTVCDNVTETCICDVEFPIPIDNLYCVKPALLGVPCVHHAQCQHHDENSVCDKNTSIGTSECQCRDQYEVKVVEGLSVTGLCSPKASSDPSSTPSVAPTLTLGAKAERLILTRRPFKGRPTTEPEGDEGKAAVKEEEEEESYGSGTGKTKEEKHRQSNPRVGEDVRESVGRRRVWGIGFPPMNYSFKLPPVPPPPPRPGRRGRTPPTTEAPQPYFDPGTSNNISAQLGTHAYLPCRIVNLGNKTISWIRNRDSHILTVDRYTFIADERFQAWHDPNTETWTLQVKYVQERDAGRYECQISTEPKMSHFVHFYVVTPLVHIPGGPDIFVNSGSTVNIKCIISAALKQPEYIFWYQGSERVVPEELSGGGQVWVERVGEDTTVGTLLIPTASPRDHGVYTCAPASLPTASVTLHVLNGEHPAAMHHGGGPQDRTPASVLLLGCVLAWWVLAGGGQSPLIPLKLGGVTWGR